MFRSSGETNFDKLLEKATSHLLLEVDLGAVLSITDLIRQKDCTPKYAVAAIRKKLATHNPHVAFYALQVLEAIVKNCGSPSHEEVATKDFMEFLRELAKTTNHDNVRDKILELIQTWAHAFRKLSSYRAVQDCVNIMKAEGCKFPPLVEADAMFTSDTAPEWQEGECCNRCRTGFGILNRKHHCRACGQIFCAKCSSKVCTVPKFGIEKEVRVCDSCFEKYGSSGDPLGRDSDSLDDPLDMLLRGGRPAPVAQPPTKPPPAQHSQAQQPRGKTEAELKEEEDLALALAISQSEAEEKEREKQRRASSLPAPQSAVPEEKGGGATLKEEGKGPGGLKKSAMAKSSFEAEDPELARYLDRNYWEQRHGQTKEEAGREETGANLHNKAPSPFQPSAPVKENKGKVEQVEEMDGFMESLRASIEMFVNRMRSNSNRGRHVSNDSTVQSLFLNITSLHSQLLNYIKVQDDWRAHYESLQEKVMQVHDARDALDDLRKDYSEKQRRIAEEVERQRQIQRAIKLQDMRQQKHLYLQQQRDLALRRIQDEERQMQLRMEQQRLGTYGGYPHRGQGYMGPPPGGMPAGPGMMMPPPTAGQGQEPPPHMHYMPPGQGQQQHYMAGQQHSNTMLNQQQPGQGHYQNPYMGQGQGPTMAPPGQGHHQHPGMVPPQQMYQPGHDPMQQQQHIPAAGQGPPQSGHGMPMSQAHGQLPMSTQGYMPPMSQNYYQQPMAGQGGAPPHHQQQAQTPGQGGPPQQMMDPGMAMYPQQQGQPGGAPPQQQHMMAGQGGSPQQHQMGQGGPQHQQMGQGGPQQQHQQGQPGAPPQHQLGQPGAPPPQQMMAGPDGAHQVVGQGGPPPQHQMVGPGGAPPQQQQGGPPAVGPVVAPQEAVPAGSNQEHGATIQREPSVAELISFD